jgi:hypothetical protein
MATYNTTTSNGTGAVVPQSAAPMPTSAPSVQFAPAFANPSMQQGGMYAAGEYSFRKDTPEEESPAPDARSGKLGVDLAVRLSELRNQSQLGRAKVRQAAGRTLLNIRGIWVDDGYDAKLPTIKVKAQSAAYFRILERHSEMREVFRLGNRLVYVTPSQAILVIDPAEGKEQMTDTEIDGMFIFIRY